MCRFAEAIPFSEKAAARIDTEFYDAGMVVSCYKVLGDTEGAGRAAHRAVVRAERAVAPESDNGSAMGCISARRVGGGRAREGMDRARDSARSRQHEHAATTSHARS